MTVSRYDENFTTSNFLVPTLAAGQRFRDVCKLGDPRWSYRPRRLEQGYRPGRRTQVSKRGGVFTRGEEECRSRKVNSRVSPTFTTKAPLCHSVIGGTRWKRNRSIFKTEDPISSMRQVKRKCCTMMTLELSLPGSNRKSQAMAMC